MQVGFAWECSCGNIVYSEESPEECLKCGNLDSFLQMPEEVLKTRDEDTIEDVPVKAAKKPKSARKKK